MAVASAGVLLSADEVALLTSAMESESMLSQSRGNPYDANGVRNVCLYIKLAAGGGDPVMMPLVAWRVALDVVAAQSLAMCRFGHVEGAKALDLLRVKIGEVLV